MDAGSKLNIAAIDVNRNIDARLYWRNRFSDFEWNSYFDEPGKLPVAPGKLPIAENKEDSVHSFQADPNTTRHLLEIAPSGKARHIVLLSVLGILARKCSFARDVCILTPLYSEQPYNSIVPVLMADFSDMDFAGYLSLVKNDLVRDFHYGNYPLNKILDVEKNDWKQYPLTGLVLQDLHPGLLPDNLHFDILFSFGISEGIDLKIKFDKRKYSLEYIDRIGGYYFNLLSELLNNREKKIKETGIISRDEKQYVLTGFNHTATKTRKEDNFLSVFRMMVEKYPDAPAICSSENEYSYSQLNSLSDKIANYLLRMHAVGKGDMVGIILEREDWLIPAILGVMKTGAAYVPIDPVYPASRIHDIIREAALPLIITRSTFIHGLITDDAKIMDLDACSRAVNEMSCDGAIDHCQGNDLAYVLFTSGSTGKPKGVMVSHLSLLNYITWAAEYYVRDRKATFPLYTSISFDLTVTSIFTPLLTGNKIIIYREVEKESVIGMLLLNKEIDIIKLTPSQLKTVTYDPGLKPAPGQPAKKLIVGGEDLTFQLAAAINDQFGGHIEIYNEYGPTESTVGCMIHRFDPREETYSVPIGHPIDNTMIYLLDRNLNPVPGCVPGDLYISGAGVARGYLRREELTRLYFIDNPFMPGQKMYKTGDIAVRDLAGRVIFQGRRDDQVKLRGYRIELGEIEDELRQYEGVKEAMVLVRDREEDKYLVAYYISDTMIGQAQLREYLSKRLPDPMVPGNYVHLNKLPLTANGKVDRRALPEPEFSPENYQGASNGTEEQLIAIWSEVLRLPAEQISVNRSFFEMGGHSLKAIELVNRIFRNMGVRVPLRQLFNHRDIRGLAAYIHSDAVKSAYASIPKPMQRSNYPLSPSQRRLYFLYEMDRLSLAYNMPRLLRLSGPLDRVRLETTFTELIDRHEILRTRITLMDGGPVQEVLEKSDFSISRFSANARDVDNIIRGFICPFDLNGGPLLRVGLITLDDGDHMLMVDMHHIITDGISQGILIKDFMSLYANERLPELRLQYKDYAEWLQSPGQQALLALQKDFWLREYADLPPVMNLPADRARPLMRSHSGGALNFSISEKETHALLTLANGEGATMFMLLLAVYTILLKRLSGYEDIVIGSPVAGRRHTDLEAMIGMFVNTLPLRNFPHGHLSFREFLQDLRSRTLSCFDHQDYPYEELVEALRPERHTGHNPLFDVVFSHENFQEGHFAIGGLRLEPYVNAEGISKFDLILTARESEGRILLNFSYAKDLFDKSTIDRFAAYFCRIVSEVTGNADILLSEIDMLPKEEKVLLLDKFGSNKDVYPRESTIVSLFEEQVRLHPDAIAVVYRDEELTYRELNQEADRLAHFLVNSGMEAAALIPICMHRSIEMIIGILGILKAGGVYVPVDPEYPAERINFILRDIGAKMVLADQSLADPSLVDSSLADPSQADPSIKLPGSIPVYVIKDLLHTIDAVSGPPPGINIDPSSLAYVNYTSGSMGYPKGVMVMHGSVTRLLKLSDIHFSTHTVTLQLSSISFDAATLEIWVALLSGGKLVLYPEAFSDIDLLNTTIRDQKVNTLWLTSGLLDRWSDSDIRELPLTSLLSGGDVVHLQTVKKIYGQLPGVAIYNGYGPTENTTFTCCYKIPPNMDSHTIPIGRPISGTSVYILDEDLNLSPVGAAGELYASGTGLARGYVNNERLTKEKFIDNPWLPGERMYRTGDMVRWLADGNIEFLGRVDDQVKILGYRIEPGEIESQLLRYEGISEAVVLTRDRDGDKYLVAYYVSETAFAEGMLRDYLMKRLPDYMIPLGYVHMPTLPLTANGKVDRRALPEPDLVPENYEGASNEIEARLTAIWSAVLKVEAGKISVNKSFFEMGGHSLKAVDLVNRIFRDMGFQVPLSELFSRRDIRGLGAYIGTGATKSVYTSIPKAPRRSYYRLSSSQQRLYFLYRLDQSSMAYNMPRVLKLSGALNPVRLETTFAGLVAHHEMLRTRFVLVEDQPVQQVLDRVDFEVSRFSAVTSVTSSTFGTPAPPATAPSATSDATPVTSGVDAIIAGFIRPFDLAEAPLLRVGLISIDEGEHLLLIDMHHIVTDGLSQKMLIRDFMSLYNKEELPEQRLHYKDYAEWLQSEEQQKMLNRQKAFWLKEYGDFPPVMNLPADRLRPLVRDHKGGSLGFSINREETRALISLGHNDGATLFMVLLAVYNILLNRLSGCEDITIGTSVAGRRHADLEGMIGMFVNTLALRNYPTGHLGFRAFLKDLSGRTLSCFNHQDFPYEQLVEALKLERNTSHNPLFDVMFTYENFEEERFELGNLLLAPYFMEEGISKFDLTLTARESEGQIFLRFTYARDLFDDSTIVRYMDYFRRIVTAIIDNPEIRISDIDILPEEEKTMLLGEFGNHKAAYPLDRTIVDLFEEQAELYPDAIAVAYKDETMSYQELNKKSDRLGHFLRARGVGKEHLVPICIQPSMEMIVGILGVLKAGGAYVPIDPGYPQDRIRYVLEDTGAKVMLTSDSCRSVIPDGRGLKVIVLDEEWDRIAGQTAGQADGQTAGQADGQTAGEAAGQTAGQSAGQAGVRLRADQLVYVIYTSGSTGMPKGVMVEHRGLVNLCYGQAGVFRLRPGMRTLQFASFGFDASCSEIFNTLLTGGCLVLPEKEDISEIDRFAALIGKHDVELITLPPSYQYIAKDVLGAVRTIVSAGEPLNREVGRYLQSRGIRLVNAYGPTENTVCISMSEDPIKEGGTVVIGRPMSNVRVYILDKEGGLVPVGVVGEIYASGAGVARGYLNRGELTAERFVPDVFSREEGARMYRTGDLGRWLPDGNIEYLGRMDSQVKIRGYRIEPGEIVSHLSSHELIEDATIVVKEEAGDKYLVAYYVSTEEIEPFKLRKYLSERLPGYMIPAFFHHLESFPLTSSGKIDRTALPDPRIISQGNAVSAGNQTQRMLGHIWSDLLGIEMELIGTDTNFFDIGGDSLKLIILVGRIQQQFGIRISIAEIFGFSTIALLAGFIDNETEADNGSDGEIMSSLEINNMVHLFNIHDGN